MNAEKFLQRAKMIETIIKAKTDDYNRWKSIANNTNGVTVSERVQASHIPHKMENAVVNYIDIEQEIEALKKERKTILATIEKLPPVEYDFIYRKYIMGYTNKELAYHFSKSYEWAKIKRKKALARLQALIDEQR